MLRLSFSLRFALLVLIFNSHVFFSSSSNKPRCHPEESSALLKLKLTILKLFWSENTDCCSWFGVTCDESTGHVIGIDFFIDSPPRLTPNSSLFSLRHLKRLDLSPKGLQIDVATFEALARNLTNLKELDLSFNDMSSVPSVLLTTLTSSLASLSLSGCPLHGEMPDIFSRFPKPESLDLSFNNLSGNIPRLCTDSFNSRNFSSNDTLTTCVVAQLPSSLTSLNLSHNSINGPIPTWIYALPNLGELELGANLFTGEIGKFQSTSLTNLVLSRNRLQGVIPRSIFQQEKLKKLDLSSNNLTGTVELGEISKLKELSHLDLSSNNLSSLSFDNSLNYSSENMSLVSLDLSNNQIKGNVPKWFWEVGKDSLEYLDLSYNFLKHIDDSLPFNKLHTLDLSSNLFSGNLPILSPHLQFFTASKNHFSENIPSSICNLKFLQGLDLSFNNISGEIPKCLGNFSLLLLDLRNNKLHGTVPVMERKQLQYLDLRSNMFSGPLPILSYNTSFFLSVSKNRFSGEIPPFICHLKFLVLLDLSDNDFSGKIPQCIGNFSEYLTVLDLRRNKLRGTIPGTFQMGNALTSLNLNGNQLEGALPRSLVNCGNLEALDLGNNMLSDTFPHWLESLPVLQVLVLRANRFHGSIGNPKPGSLPFLKLRIMDLSYNEFSGDLPTEYFRGFQAMQMDAKNAKMGYMGEDYYHETVMVTMKGSYIQLERIQTILTTIDFSNNNFSGEIPELMGSLRSLKGLNFARNKLTGTIPSSLGNLTNLEWLDLSSNKLVGHIPLELVNVPWLSFLNLSHNRLEGPIPHGSQFNTFGNESFSGNLDLCGFPLTKACGEDTKPSPPPTLEQDDDDHDSSITNGFNWKIVMMGYASGFVIGISIGYILLYSNGKLSRLSERILEELRRPDREGQREVALAQHRGEPEMRDSGCNL